MRVQEERTTFGQLDEIQLLALLGSRHMRRQKRIHEGFEIGPPPLRNGIRNVPLVIDALTRELGPRRCQALVET